MFRVFLEVLTTEIREEKGIQIGQEDVKLSKSADDMIVYIENPKDTTRKLLELINKFSKVAAYKINTQKSLAYLYKNNEISETEMKIITTLIITPKITKYLRINTPKEAKDLY